MSDNVSPHYFDHILQVTQCSENNWTKQPIDWFTIKTFQFMVPTADPFFHLVLPSQIVFIAALPETEAYFIIIGHSKMARAN